jgi:hypothetical protein
MNFQKSDLVSRLEFLIWIFGMEMIVFWGGEDVLLCRFLGHGKISGRRKQLKDELEEMVRLNIHFVSGQS